MHVAKNGESQERSAVRGLATVALLKVNYDAGRDHLGMFEPFVLDTLAQMGADGIGVEDMRKRVHGRHQLSLPFNTLQTLLNRIRRKGFLRREGGRYFRTDKALKLDDLSRAREKVEQRQGRLADALREACKSRNVEIETREQALGMILEFLEEYHVALALDDLGEPRAKTDAAAEEGNGDRRAAATAAFLQETVLAGGELAEVVQEMLEGFILQNTLLLKDISVAARRFGNLHVFFDSGLLFDAIGLSGTFVHWGSTFAMFRRENRRLQLMNRLSPQALRSVQAARTSHE
jgi:hypothetical protein